MTDGFYKLIGGIFIGYGIAGFVAACKEQQELKKLREKDREIEKLWLELGEHERTYKSTFTEDEKEEYFKKFDELIDAIAKLRI